MALTGSNKYKVRELLKSGDPDKAQEAHSILKECGYTDREISNWVDNILSVKKHEAKAEFMKMFNGPRDIYKDWPPTFLVGPEHKELFEKCMKELYGDFIIEDEK